MHFPRIAGLALLATAVFSVSKAQELVVVAPDQIKTYELNILTNAFEPKTVETISTWTGTDIVSYQGVSLEDVLNAHNLQGKIIEISAENGYVSKIPRDMIQEFQPIIAFEADGKPLDFASRGPLSLIWPRSEYPELLGETIDGMWTWYVNEIREIN